MLDEIEADVPPGSESGFRTPEEAIAFSQSIDRVRQNNSIASCIGKMICAVDWRDDAIFLRLENDKFVCIQSVLNIVELSVSDDALNNLVEGSREPETVLVHLGDQNIYWKRGALMQGLQGNTFRGAHAGESGLFLYVACVGILAVNVLIDRVTGRPFLFWGPTD